MENIFKKDDVVIEIKSRTNTHKGEFPYYVDIRVKYKIGEKKYNPIISLKSTEALQKLIEVLTENKEKITKIHIDSWNNW